MLQRIEFLPADVLGLSPLARAARTGRLDIPGLAPRAFSEIARLPDPRDPELRIHLARWIEAQITRLGPHVRVIESARALAEPEARCVLTGLRPGLLSSPLDGLWNACACVRLAEELSERWGTPVVPVAWIRADELADGDMARTWIPNRHHELQRIGLAGAQGGATTTARLALDEEVHRLAAVRSLLSQLYGDHPHAAEAIALLVPRGGESLAQAATRALLGLLGHRGLVVLDPEWLRDETSQALAAVVGRDLRAPLERGSRELAARGLTEDEDVVGSALVLRSEGTTRRALRLGGDGFRYDRELGSRTPAELAAEIVQEPARWSPGPLLRPWVAERVLPVAAHLGGEHELHFHALLRALRADLGATGAPFVLRTAVTLVDEETARSLARLELSAADALRRRGRVEAQPAAAPAPPVVEDLRRIMEGAQRTLLERREALARIEPSLAGQLRRAVDQARDAIERVCQKAERVHGDHGGRGRRHLRRVQTVLAPNGEPQERVLGPFTFLARYGTAWIDALIAEWAPFAPEHVAAFLGSNGTEPLGSSGAEPASEDPGV